MTTGNTSADKEPQSIWSVGNQGLVARYFGLLTLFFWAGMLYLLINEIFVSKDTDINHLVVFWINHAGNVGTGAAIMSLITMEAPTTAMVIARYLNEKLIKRQREKFQKQGSEQGQKETNSHCREWVDRRDKAHAAGETFSDPAPDQR